ncbi:plasmid pRiA4b ORF-3 family protein [Glutamicibacter nicotianae]|nr:plasmid pRiA4b ORF-3 family protein [Glutamicibacter nicotianae]
MTGVISLQRMLTVRIELVGSDPLIWRTMDMDDSLMLDEAGLALQCAMGWEHAHLQAFHSINPHLRSRTDEAITWYEEQSRLEIGLGEAQETTTLGQALRAAEGELYFEYDFGDGWMHKITVVSQHAKAAGDPPYRVVDGELRAPLEDSGGIHGWYEKLGFFNGNPAPDSWEDLEDDEAEQIIAWMHWRGGRWNPFNPGVFDAEVAGRRLELLAAQGAGFNGLGRWFESMDPELRLAMSVPAAQIGLGLQPAGGPPPSWFIQLVRPFTVLAELCSDGLILTKAGWMPPKVVGDLVERSDLEGIDFESGSSKRENNMLTVARIREAAQRMGHLRKAKGVLTTTQRGRKLMDDPTAMAEHMASRLAQYKGNDVRDRNIECDSTFAGWLIRAGRYIPDRMQRYSAQPEFFLDRSEILEIFGYWDPNQQRPVNGDSWLPSVEEWYLVERLLEYRLHREDKKEELNPRLAELSRYLLQH